MSEDPALRLKRLRLRSWRRGIKEMDLILGGFADERLEHLQGADLDAYDALLVENDHDLYAWITGKAEAPQERRAIVEQIARHASARPDPRHGARPGGT